MIQFLLTTLLSTWDNRIDLVVTIILSTWDSKVQVVLSILLFTWAKRVQFVLIVTTPTQPQLNSKVGFDTKMNLHHHISCGFS